MNMHSTLMAGAAFGLFLLMMAGCDRPAGSSFKYHPLNGAWLATDGTIFHFRDDGTFHGVNLNHREIWGNWVILSDRRIGFQSLLHDSYYRPQYAIIRESNKDEMDYIVTGGNRFILAERIPTEEAITTIEEIVAPQVHNP